MALIIWKSKIIRFFYAVADSIISTIIGYNFLWAQLRMGSCLNVHSNSDATNNG